MERATRNRPALRGLRLTPTGWHQRARRKAVGGGPAGTYRNRRLPGRTVEFIFAPLRQQRLHRRLARKLRQLNA